LGALPDSSKTAIMSALSPTILPQASEGRRIRRLAGRFIGGGYVAYFVVAIPEIRADAAIVAPWWTPLALVLAFVPGWALGAASFVRHRVWLSTVIPLACGGGYLAALALWFLAWNGGEVTGSRGTWLVMFPGVASMAVVLAGRPWLALVNLALSAPTALIASGLGRSDLYGHWTTIGEIAWAATFSALFVVAGIMAVRTGDLLDASREKVASIAGRAAAQQARDAERSWYDKLIHDRVLMVMQHVRAGDTNTGLVPYARQAMDELVAGSPEGPTSGTDLVALMRAVIADVDSRIVVIAPPWSPDFIEVPSSVTREIVDAAAEATRNCVRHAGSDATATVRIDADAVRVRVRIDDDGDGFDPHTVRRDRMGLAFSIRQRMTAVGGRATIDTAVGLGTRVLLQWPHLT
jgi:hypothetical protein